MIKESWSNGYEEKHLFEKKQAKDQTCDLLYRSYSNVVHDFAFFLPSGQVAG